MIEITLLRNSVKFKDEVEGQIDASPILSKSPFMYNKENITNYASMPHKRTVSNMNPSFNLDMSNHNPLESKIYLKFILYCYRLRPKFAVRRL